MTAFVGCNVPLIITRQRILLVGEVLYYLLISSIMAQIIKKPTLVCLTYKCFPVNGNNNVKMYLTSDSNCYKLDN